MAKKNIKDVFYLYFFSFYTLLNILTNVFLIFDHLKRKQIEFESGAEKIK